MSIIHSRARSILASIAIAGLLLGTLTTAQAIDVAKNGKKSCAGNVNTVNETRYFLRNLNSNRSIRLDRIQVFDGNGTLAYDSSSDGFIAGIKTTLPPHNGTAFNMSALLAAGSGSYATGPGTVEFQWTVTGAKMGIPLAAGGKRVLRDFTTGQTVAERPQRCQDIPFGF